MDLDRRTVLGLAGAGLVGGLALNTTRASVSGRVTGPGSRPDASEDEIAAYTRENAAFGLDLLGVLAEREPASNRMISPASVSGALAMAWVGARGETEAQMRETLRFPHGRDDLHRAIGALQYDLGRRAEAVPRFEVPQVWRTNRFELAVANALWGQADVPFRESFLETVDRYYGGGFRTVDFRTDAAGAREEINDWAARETNGRVDELFPRGSIDRYTRLVLTNAVYLLADWDQPFDTDDTEERSFTAIDGATQRVPMMRQTGDFPYVGAFDEDDGVGYRAVELPYVGGDLGMVLLSPWDRGADFREFEAVVDGEWLAARFAALDEVGEREVEVTMPRFAFETETHLSAVLEEMGMPDAFDAEEANFDGIVPPEELDGRLHVQEVFHDTYVAVDEAGTEAAAVTGVQMGVVSGPARMTLDRPFLFCVRDRETDAVLFLGRIVDAEAASG